MVILTIPQCKSTNEKHKSQTVLCYILFLFFQEKNCCPLHVAAKAGQAAQVELLMVYGADPGAFDGQGNTPALYARSVTLLFRNY